jgi:hypothetical protein
MKELEDCIITMVPYDDKYTCSLCNGTNKIEVVDYMNSTVCECNTTCAKCGHKNYWAHGYFQQ